MSVVSSQSFSLGDLRIAAERALAAGEADGAAYVPLYTEADIAHYIETRWQDFAKLLGP